MIAMSPYFESALAPLAVGALKQAAIWGGGSALAAKLSSGKKEKETEEEKKERRKNLLIQGLIGAGAGALGSIV